MMPKLCAQIKDTWLDSAIPGRLADMEAFQKAIALVQNFAGTLNDLEWTGAQELHEWVINAPKIWLSKRRETVLDDLRNRLSSGMFQIPL
jgi:centromere/kinetochore protein ZW10